MSPKFWLLIPILITAVLGSTINVAGSKEPTARKQCERNWSLPVVQDKVSQQLISDAAVVSRSNIWAVGRKGNFPLQHLVLRSNGRDWKEIAVPTPGDGGSFSSLSVISPRDIWLVGDYWTPYEGTNFFKSLPLAMHWEGRKWNFTPVPIPPQASSAELSTASLSSVSAVSAGDVWAAGYYETHDRFTLPTFYLFVVHWDGKRWSQVPVPPIDKDGVLFERKGVFTRIKAFGPNDVWALRSTEEEDSSEGWLFHWNGSQWTEFPYPTYVNIPPRGMAVGVSKNLWLSTKDNRVFRLDEGRWTELPKPPVEPWKLVVQKGELWVSNGTSVAYYDRQMWRIATPPASIWRPFTSLRPFFELIPGKGNEIWVVGGLENLKAKKWPPDAKVFVMVFGCGDVLKRNSKRASVARSR